VRPEEIVGDRVRTLRMANQWSQEELASKMQQLGFNWTQSMAAKTERAARPLRVDELVALADIFKVKLEGLVAADPDPMAIKLEELLAALRAAQRTCDSLERERDAKVGQLAEMGALVKLLTSKIDMVKVSLDRHEPLSPEQIKELDRLMSWSRLPPAPPATPTWLHPRERTP
jgi:transcriptional regulator with XRE-family HTH domain